MDMVLFIIGLLLFVGSLVYLVVSLIKKRFTKKKIHWCISIWFRSYDNWFIYTIIYRNGF